MLRRELFRRGAKKGIRISWIFNCLRCFFRLLSLLCVPVAVSGTSGEVKRNSKVIKQSYEIWFLFMTSDSSFETKEKGETFSFPRKSLRNSFYWSTGLAEKKETLKELWNVYGSCKFLFAKVNLSLRRVAFVCRGRETSCLSLPACTHETPFLCNCISNLVCSEPINRPTRKKRDNSQ